MYYKPCFEHHHHSASLCLEEPRKATYVGCGIVVVTVTYNTPHRTLTHIDMETKPKGTKLGSLNDVVFTPQVQKTLSAARSSKETSLLRQHRQVWSREHLRLRTAE